MSPDAMSILRLLREVAAERERRRGDPELQARVDAAKRYQHARFAKSYADTLQHPRFAAAARFFMEDLYGPHDFSERDSQFVRVVPALGRLFPPDLVSTVRALAELHALSESLDTRLAQALTGTVLDGAAYAAAWRTVGEPGARERQIALMLEVGTALERFTQKPVLRQSLRLMRAPARAAGLGALQSFLEKGFDTFRSMKGAAEFLTTIAQRERAMASALFAPLTKETLDQLP
jgi:hypothetical protein